MKKITDANEVKRLMTKKENLEDSLAKDVYSAFDTGSLKTDLNKMVYIAAIKMDQWKSKMAGLDVVKKYGTAGQIAEAAKNVRLSAEHCGDLIRLYGEAAENYKFAENVGVKSELEKLNAQRVDLQKYKELGLWDKERGGGRQRVKAQEEINPSKKLGKWKDGSDFKDQSFVKPQMVKRRSDSEMNAMGGGGIAAWMPTDRDILYRIESTFGLKIGATLSGTTTDTIFFLRTIGAQVNDDPVFYLLPVATIASRKHHSLVEVAAALTINDIITYSIGSYSSLMPSNSKHQQADTLRRLLENYQNKGTENDRFIIHRKGLTDITGCFLYDPSNKSEIRAFECLATTNKRFLEEFKALNKGYMTEADIVRWIMQRRQVQGAPAFLAWS